MAERQYFQVRGEDAVPYVEEKEFDTYREAVSSAVGWKKGFHVTRPFEETERIFKEMKISVFLVTETITSQLVTSDPAEG